MYDGSDEEEYIPLACIAKRLVSENYLYGDATDSDSYNSDSLPLAQSRSNQNERYFRGDAADTDSDNSDSLPLAQSKSNQNESYLCGDTADSDNDNSDSLPRKLIKMKTIYVVIKQIVTMITVTHCLLLN